MLELDYYIRKREKMIRVFIHLFLSREVFLVSEQLKREEYSLRGGA